MPTSRADTRNCALGESYPIERYNSNVVVAAPARVPNIRRDSPNGKRFARRGQGGGIEDAFGFDLTPLVARAEEIENLAEEVRANTTRRARN